MRRLLCFALFMTAYSTLLYAGQAQDIKFDSETDDLQQRVSRLSKNFLPWSGGDDVFFMDRKNDRVIASTIAVTYNMSAGSINGSSGTITTNLSVGTITINSSSFTYVPWTAYTPTLSAAWGTTSNVEFIYTIHGDTMFIQGSFKTGTLTSAAATISLPSGYIINTDILTMAGEHSLGVAYEKASTTANIYSGDRAGVLYWASTANRTALTYSFRVSGTGFQQTDITGVITGGSDMSISAHFPIQKT